jgi:hypothetical protein
MPLGDNWHKLQPWILATLITCTLEVPFALRQCRGLIPNTAGLAWPFSCPRLVC